MPLSDKVRDALDDLFDFLSIDEEKYQFKTGIKSSLGRIFIRINDLETKLYEDSTDLDVFNFFAQEPAIRIALRLEASAALAKGNLRLQQILDIIAPEEEIQKILTSQTKEKKSHPSTNVIDSSLSESPQIVQPDRKNQEGREIKIAEEDRDFLNQPLDDVNQSSPSRSGLGLDLQSGLADKKSSSKSKDVLSLNVLNTITEAELKKAEEQLKKETKLAPTNNRYFHDRLSQAAREDDLPMIAFLCQKGIDPNIDYPADEKYINPMKIAAQKGHDEAVILLIQLNYHLKPEDVRSFIFSPKINHNLFPPQRMNEVWGTRSQIVRSDNTTNQLFYDLRFKNAYEGIEKTFEFLAETELKTTDINKRTLLHYAVAGGNLNIVKRICEAHREFKIPAEKSNQFNNTPLTTAIIYDYIYFVDAEGRKADQGKPTGIVPYLIEVEKFRLTYVDKTGNTPLHFVRSLNMLKYLLTKAIEINPETKEPAAVHIIRSVNRRQETALMTICQSGVFQDGEISQIILHLINLDRRFFPGLDENALVNTRNASRETLLHMLLEEDVGKLSAKQIEEAISTLASAPQALVNTTSDSGITPLISAIQKGPTSHVKILLDNKADVNLRSQTRHTPLMYVREFKTAKLLIDHGARVNEVDSLGRSALHYACGPTMLDCEKIIGLLIQKGLDVNTVAHESKTTPLEETIKRRDREELSAVEKQNKINALIKHHAIVTENTLVLALQHLKPSKEKNTQNKIDCNVILILLKSYLQSGKKLNKNLTQKLQSFINHRVISPHRELMKGMIADMKGEVAETHGDYNLARQHYDEAHRKYTETLATDSINYTVFSTLADIHLRKAQKIGFRKSSIEKDEKKRESVETLNQSESNYKKIFELLQIAIQSLIKTKEHVGETLFYAIEIENLLAEDRLNADSLSRKESLQLDILRRSVLHSSEINADEKIGVVESYLETVRIKSAREFSPLSLENNPEVILQSDKLAEEKISLEEQLKRVQAQFLSLSHQEAVLRHLGNLSVAQRKSLLQKLTDKAGKDDFPRELNERETLQLTALQILRQSNFHSSQDQFIRLHQQHLANSTERLQSLIQKTSQEMNLLSLQDQQSLLKRLEQKERDKETVLKNRMSIEERVQFAALQSLRTLSPEDRAQLAQYLFPDQKSMASDFPAANSIQSFSLMLAKKFDLALDKVEIIWRSIIPLDQEKQNELFEKLRDKELNQRMALEISGVLTQKEAFQLAMLKQIVNDEKQVEQITIIDLQQHYLRHESERIQHDINYIANLPPDEQKALFDRYAPEQKIAMENKQRELSPQEQQILENEKIQLAMLKQLQTANQLDHEKPKLLTDELERLHLTIQEFGEQLNVLAELIELSHEEQIFLLENLQNKRHADLEEKLTFLRPLQFQVLKLLMADTNLTASDNLTLAWLIYHLRYDPEVNFPLTPSEYANLAKTERRAIAEPTIDLPADEKVEGMPNPQVYIKMAYDRALKAVNLFEKNGMSNESSQVKKALRLVKFLKMQMPDEVVLSDAMSAPSASPASQLHVEQETSPPRLSFFEKKRGSSPKQPVSTDLTGTSSLTSVTESSPSLNSPNHSGPKRN